MRILRVKPPEVMSDAATLLGISTSLMSAVENGKKNAATEWFAVIAEHYTLTDEEQAELREVIENSKTQIKLNLSRASADQRESALQNACSFSEMDDNTALKILELLKKSGNDTVLAGQKDKLMSECKEFLRSQISTGKTVYLCYDHLAQSVPNHLP